VPLPSPAPPSPTEMYITRQSGSPGPAVGLKMRSPIGWMLPDMFIRRSSRAVPWKAVSAMFVSVHSMSTVWRELPPAVVTVGVVV
jgi:hypothetical protein